MPATKDALKDRLSRSREINITVTGRKSGRTISIPVWFVFENDKLYLLPVKGSETHSYRNGLKDPTIRIDASGAEAEVKGVPVTCATEGASLVERLPSKYGSYG